jgi:hypothetical protein
VRFLKSIQTDEYRVGGGLERERAVGVDDDGEKANVMGVFNDVLDTALSLAPEERLTSMKVQTPSALLVEGVRGGGDFLEAQM